MRLTGESIPSTIGLRAGVLEGVLIFCVAGLLVALGLSFQDRSIWSAGGPDPRGVFPSKRPLAGAVDGRCPSGCTHSPRAMMALGITAQHNCSQAKLAPLVAT